MGSKKTKRFLALATTVVAVSSVAPMAHAQDVEQEDIYLYPLQNDGGGMYKSSKPITTFDFTPYEDVLHKQGAELDIKLVNVLVKLHDLTTGDKIDFGSYANLKLDAQNKIQAGHTYEFYFEGEFEDKKGYRSHLVPQPSGYAFVAESKSTKVTDIVDPKVAHKAYDLTLSAGLTRTVESVKEARKEVDKLPESELKTLLEEQLSLIERETAHRPSTVENQVKTEFVTIPIIKGNSNPFYYIKTHELTSTAWIKGKVEDSVNLHFGVTPSTDLSHAKVSLYEHDSNNSRKLIYADTKEFLTSGTSVELETNIPYKAGVTYTIEVETESGYASAHVQMDKGLTLILDDFKEPISIDDYLDVPKTHWAYNDIFNATQRGITSGRLIEGFRYFDPEANISRAEVIVMLLRSLNIDFDNYQGDNFKDAKGKWYANAVGKAKELGLTKGYTDGTFKGDENVTREHLAAFLSRAYIDDTNRAVTNNTFTDVSPTAWSAKDINIIADLGITKGYPDKTFKPKNQATRAQTITMIMRVLDYENLDVDLINLNKYTEATSEDLKLRCSFEEVSKDCYQEVIDIK